MYLTDTMYYSGHQVEYFSGQGNDQDCTIPEFERLKGDFCKIDHITVSLQY